MFYSQLFGRSDKSDGAQLKIKSHRLLVQAGYIRESVAGRYYFLPLGRRLQLKLMAVIRQEMDKVGALEVVAPILHPLELWQETNRASAAGFELMQLKDRRGSGFALGGTAEEMFVDLVRKFNLSYKDLPFNLYQFGLKFRDELRARGGLLRVREFIMKDAYSFSTPEQFTAVYEQMRDTYLVIFARVGLSVKVVAADGGYIGGEYCHEFIADADVGESLYFETDKGYLAHEDVAIFEKSVENSSQLAPLQKVKALRGPTMADSQRLHQPVPLSQHIKNVVYLNEKQEIVLACLRGDLDVNEVKLQRAAQCHQLTPLSNEQIRDWLHSEPGFISAAGLKSHHSDHSLLIVADDSLSQLVNGISGANELNQDLINMNFKRDYDADVVADIALAKDGYRALEGQVLRAAKGIEVGNIFQLGYHYSDKMKGAEYVDATGKRQRYYMGCYGIGIGRTLAAIAEIKSDDRGLIWPTCLTPYDIYLADLVTDDASKIFIGELKTQLEDAGWAILCDDRDQVTAGEKLANADLLGFPIRIVVSKKTLAGKQLEIKARRAVDVALVSPSQADECCRKLWRSADEI